MMINSFTQNNPTYVTTVCVQYNTNRNLTSWSFQVINLRQIMKT